MNLRPLLPRSRGLLALLLLFGAAGCITESQVKELVRDSNYHVLAAAVPGGGVAADGKNDPATEEASARLNAFLEGHKDDPVMASALRFRQALLYLNQRAFALADASQQLVNAGALRSPRDRAIFAAYADLRWWSEWSLAYPATFYASEGQKARAHLDALARHADAARAAELPDLHDYFLEMRAWIGLKLGLASADPAFARSTLQDAVNVWAQTFSPAELAGPPAPPASAKPLELSTRRVLRLRALLTQLAAETKDVFTPDLAFEPPGVNQFFATLRK